MSKPSCAARAALASLAAVIALTGCESMSERQRGTAAGAGIGAATGAVVGSATGGKAGTGAAIGGVVGAVAGNLWSKRMEQKRAEMQRTTEGTGIAVVRTPDNQLKLNVPSDFSFDSGSAQIKPQMRPVLDQFAQGLDPKMRVTIVGHTDSVGGEDLNNRLSVDRAVNVRAYLGTHGVDASRMIANGRGEREPIAGNDTPAGRAQNRRVEIFLSEPSSRG
ncbi:MAG: OmpA family protein [Burkholderiales bacterium]|nr:OmpA family protein [Burkholderiales bacterium]